MNSARPPSKISTLGYALLALLARRPGTGYDLTVRMQRPIGYFWHAAHSQIYPELARLAAAGLIKQREVSGPGPLPTKEYAITMDGRGALTAWTTEAPEARPERDAFMLKIYSLWLGEPGAALTMLTDYRDARRALRDEYLQHAAGLEAGGNAADLTHPDFGAYATLQAGLRHETYLIEWLDWLISVFEADPRGG